jgi:nucleoside-diphosphate-sugar epimerase
MQIFVAGATGVVGKRLVPLLVGAGHGVTGVARSEAKSSQLERQGARPMAVDLFDAAAVSRAVAGHDVVINVATHIPSGAKAALPGAFKENNRLRQEASKNLANAAAAAGAERFIQESFVPVYPDRGDEWIDETVPINPSRYVATVLDAERAASEFTRRGGAGIVLRFSLFYGPDSSLTLDTIRAVRKGIAPSFGSPEGFMSSIWTDDAATAVLSALHVPAGVYNVTDNVPVRRKEFFDALAAALGVKRPRLVPQWITRLTGSLGETLGRSLRLSNARFRAASGWVPAVPSVLEGWPLLVRELGKARRRTIST